MCAQLGPGMTFSTKRSQQHQVSDSKAEYLFSVWDNSNQNPLVGSKVMTIIVKFSNKYLTHHLTLDLHARGEPSTMVTARRACRDCAPVSSLHHLLKQMDDLSSDLAELHFTNINTTPGSTLHTAPDRSWRPRKSPDCFKHLQNNSKASQNCSQIHLARVYKRESIFLEILIISHFLVGENLGAQNFPGNNNDTNRKLCIFSGLCTILIKIWPLGPEISSFLWKKSPNSRLTFCCKFCPV